MFKATVKLANRIIFKSNRKYEKSKQILQISYKKKKKISKKCKSS